MKFGRYKVIESDEKTAIGYCKSAVQPYVVWDSLNGSYAEHAVFHTTYDGAINDKKDRISSLNAMKLKEMLNG